MRQRITRIIVRFAITIGILLLLVLFFNLYVDTLSQQQQDEVLIKAIPFVGVFVSILLAFICFIVVLAVLLHGKVPPRTFRPIEYILIAGILLGVVGLFQGWKLFVYENGFMLLLISILSFIVWSHVIPMPAGEAKKLPAFSQRAQMIALVAGVVVWIAASAYISLSVEPEEPYGVAPRVWEMILDDDERAQLREDFDEEYTTNRIPLAVLISVMPGLIAFFAARELASPRPDSLPPAPKPVSDAGEVLPASG